jgi:hypothetical protein
MTQQPDPEPLTEVTDGLTVNSAVMDDLTIAGESRANLIRVLAIAIFFLQHCVNFYFLNADNSLTERLHTQVTLLVAAWGSVAALVYHVVQRQCLPASFSLMTLMADLVLTFLLVNVAGGPQSSLVLLFPIIVFSSALRQDLSLVRIAVAGSVLAYGVLLANYAWNQTGAERYYSEASLRIARSEQLIVAASIVVSGLMAGQIVRQRRTLVTQRLTPVSASGEKSHG